MKVCRYVAGAGEQCAEAERKAASTVLYCTVQYSPCNLTLVKDKRRPAGASYIVWGTSWQPTPGPSLLLLGAALRSVLSAAHRAAAQYTELQPGNSQTNTHSREDLEGKIVLQVLILSACMSSMY